MDWSQFCEILEKKLAEELLQNNTQLVQFDREYCIIRNWGRIIFLFSK